MPPDAVQKYHRLRLLVTQSFFSPLIYGIKSRTRNISPKLARKWVPSCTSLDTWRCSISVATVVDEAVHERQPYTTTKILQLPVELSQNGDGGCFGQLKGRWRVLLRRCECSQENTKKAALACIVLHNICLEKGDAITREMDLAIDPKTREENFFK